jgi:murein DD-endopeptidase MepM/ murein hydrolase activator NlpD
MNSNNFSSSIKKNVQEVFPVLGKDISKHKYVPLDLSETNTFLNTVDVSSSSKLENYVNSCILKENGIVAYGGYLEVRNIYKRSEHFNSQSEDERNIHIGIDLWCAAKTPIYAPFDSVVSSFKNNSNFGDYGPTIILKHSLKGLVFYTLYGHLSLSSIASLKVGQKFNQGDKIAILGDASVNGDYPPHLHFQIIKNIENADGDYPGVCAKKDLEFYKDNCPDPNILLELGF